MINHRSKYTKYKILSRNRNISDFLPYTSMATKEDLKIMLERYSSIYCKPDIGSFGKGIFKIEKSDDTLYKQTSVKTKEPINISSTRFMLPRNYIIQQGIDLCTIDDRIVDFRIITTKKNDKWKYQGMIARQAGKDKIVSNFSAGGTACDVISALNSIANHSKISLIKKMREISVEASSVLDASFNRGLSKLGIDIAIDKNHNMWILEVNTTPQVKMFTIIGSEAMRKRVSVPNRIKTRSLRRV